MDLQCEDPGAGGAARGARADALGQATSSSKSRAAREALTARVLPDGTAVTVTGREAQTLRLLMAVGPAGFTSGEASPLGWARRTSHYVFKLRSAGFPIATSRESTPDGAIVARYALTAPVSIVQEASE